MIIRIIHSEVEEDQTIQQETEVDQTIQAETAVNRTIQDLPEELILIILSSVLTSNAIQMGGILRNCQNIWKFLNVLDFDEYSGPLRFCLFVEWCLIQRRNDMLNSGPTEIRRFRLAIRPFHVCTINRWISLVGTSNVQDLDLHFYLSDNPLRQMYRLPQDALPERSLTRLRLTNVDMTGLRSTGLPLLKSLYLSVVKLDNRILHGLLSKCSKLENLDLEFCFGLYYPEFSSSSLKSIRIGFAVYGTGYLEAANLDSFEFSGFRFIISNRTLGNLRRLTLLDTPLHTILLKFLVCTQLPCLESLTLYHCEMNSIEIQSRSLKQFVLSVRSRNIRMRVEIDAPSIVDFCFQGSLVDLSMNAQNISISNVEFSDRIYDMEWYTGLIRFLQQLDFSTNLILRAQSQETLIIPNEVRIRSTAPIRNVNALTVEIIQPSVITSEFEDSLGWMTNTKS